MNLVYLFGGTGLSFLFLSFVFIPMEKVFPAKKEQKIFRPNWLLDFCFFIGQYLLWGSVIFLVLDYFGDFLSSIVSKDFQSVIKAQPFYLQMIEMIVLSDFLIYWGHRFQHKNNFLWRFHKVHHTSRHLDWLAAHREHPLDSIYTIGLINLPAFIMGFPLYSIAGLIAFRGIWAIYIHSNVRMPLPWLRVLIGAPELHHWHHDLDRRAGNYANISPLMDVIFGTYKCPDHEPEEFGINEKHINNYFGQLVEPIFPRLYKKYMDSKKQP